MGEIAASAIRATDISPSFRLSRSHTGIVFVDTILIPAGELLDGR